jgi:hypothetical protein
MFGRMENSCIFGHRNTQKQTHDVTIYKTT